MIFNFFIYDAYNCSQRFFKIYFISLEFKLNPFAILILIFFKFVFISPPSLHTGGPYACALQVSSNATSVPSLLSPFTQLAVSVIYVKWRPYHLSLLLENFLWVPITASNFSSMRLYIQESPALQFEKHCIRS